MFSYVHLLNSIYSLFSNTILIISFDSLRDTDQKEHLLYPYFSICYRQRWYFPHYIKISKLSFSITLGVLFFSSNHFAIKQIQWSFPTPITFLPDSLPWFFPIKFIYSLFFLLHLYFSKLSSRAILLSNSFQVSIFHEVLGSQLLSVAWNGISPSSYSSM